MHGSHKTRIADIITLASRLSGMPVATIRSKQRYRSVVRVRQAVMAIAGEQGRSTTEIAHLMGLKCHSTVLHGLKMVPVYMRTEPEFADFVAGLRHECATCEPFVAEQHLPPCIRFNLVHSYSAPRQRKPINDTLPGEERDGSHRFHDEIAKASEKLANALSTVAL